MLFPVDRANIVIIGGGVVGCAVARAVSRRWSDVFLVEQMPKLGMGASTRNSGVIHSGIYYPPGSLKAQLCVEGNRMLHEMEDMTLQRGPRPFSLHTSRQIMRMLGRGDDRWRKYLFY